MLTPESSAGRTIRMATAKATVILRHYVEGGAHRKASEVYRLMPIVDETTTIADRRNSRLKSRAQVSDGSGRRFFAMQGLIFLLGQRVTMRGNDRVGVTGRTVD
jgi:hypothetical protein